MPCILFETPGLIDLRAFTLMGVSAKPNSANPIGYFGTGLKYAMSTLVRLGCKPVVWIGNDKYTFFQKDDKFRDVDFSQMWMRSEKFKLRARNIMLPYAVNYGRNWLSWMAFRELEANTRDENGSTEYCTANTEAITGYKDFTRIVIDHPDFIKAWETRSEIFLDDSPREGKGISILDEPSKYIYWRGLRVFEPHKPCSWRYNFLDHMKLTEDRTLPEWEARWALGVFTIHNDDEFLIEHIVTCEDRYWESDIIYPDLQPSQAFKNVMARNPKGMRGNAYGYFSRYDDRPRAVTFNLFDKHPLPWKLEGTQVVDKNGSAVFMVPYGYEGRWEVMAEKLLEGINPKKQPALVDYIEPINVGFKMPESSVDDVPF